MADYHFFLVLAAIVLPLVGALLARMLARPRTIAITIATITLLLTGIAVAPVLPHNGVHDLLTLSSSASRPFEIDELAAVPMLLFAALTPCVLLSATTSTLTGRGYAGVLVLLSGTLAAYAAASPLMFFAAWILSVVPFLAGAFRNPGESPQGRRRSLPPVAMVSSCILLGGGLLLNEYQKSAELWAFALIVLAALLRSGIFPFQTWVIAAFSEGPILPIGLLVNAHFGALLFARVAIPLFPELSRTALPLISDLALISAVYTAFVGLGESNPRRLLALMMLSQVSFILAGLESRTAEGITGALTHWMVVSVAMMGLLVVYNSLQARGVITSDSQFLGLAGRAPRMAVFFAVCGLALVGLPGTLGFAAEDLLFHGALENHPLLGVALPLATALNAVNIYRLFSRLFMGKRTTSVPVFPDALPRERAVLAAFVLFLVVAGLVPSRVLPLQADAAHRLAALLSEGTAKD